MKTTSRHLMTLAAMGAALLLFNMPAQASNRPYPLNVCLVTGNELGSMGKVITTSHEGQEVKLCCKPCIKKFAANPAKYLGKLKK